MMQTSSEARCACHPLHVCTGSWLMCLSAMQPPVLLTTAGTQSFQTTFVSYQDDPSCIPGPRGLVWAALNSCLTSSSPKQRASRRIAEGFCCFLVLLLCALTVRVCGLVPRSVHSGLCSARVRGRILSPVPFKPSLCLKYLQVFQDVGFFKFSIANLILIKA